MRWSVPRMWEGDTCAVLASGPSMSQAVADAARGLRVIVINNTFRLAPWADLLYAADATWWDHPENKDAHAFAGLRVTCTDNKYRDILRLQNTGRIGFDPDPANVRTGGNSGYQAVHIAAHAGCRRILLCGFDMHGGHWHERHKPPLRDHGEGIYQRWIDAFCSIVPEMTARGIEVINCTPGSKLHCFRMMPLADARALPATREPALQAG